MAVMARDIVTEDATSRQCVGRMVCCLHANHFYQTLFLAHIYDLCVVSFSHCPGKGTNVLRI